MFPRSFFSNPCTNTARSPCRRRTMTRDPPDFPSPVRAIRSFITPPPRSASIMPAFARPADCQRVASVMPAFRAKRANDLDLYTANRFRIAEGSGRSIALGARVQDSAFRRLLISGPQESCRPWCQKEFSLRRERWHGCRCGRFRRSRPGPASRGQNPQASAYGSKRAKTSR